MLTALAVKVLNPHRTIGQAVISREMMRKHGAVSAATLLAWSGLTAIVMPCKSETAGGGNFERKKGNVTLLPNVAFNVGLDQALLCCL
jgi:hypothetical protein